MKNLLIICPSRGRPNRAEQMYDSVISTSQCDILFIIDDDDPTFTQYFSLFPSKLFILGKNNVTKKINEAFSLFKNDYKFFSVSNDDFIYHTPGWDDVFIKILNDSGGGIAYGNDTIQKENMPTTSVISGDIVRALGWLQMPTLTHLYGDEVWKHIGNELKILHYVPEVIIEHNHWFKNKELIDDIYLKTNSTEMYNIDRIAFTEWKVKQSKTDIETIKGVLDGTNINKT